MIVEEDLSVYFEVWGENAVLDGQAVRVIFGSPHADLPVGEGGMATSQPRALIASASVPAATVDDTADSVLELSESAALRPGMPGRYRVAAVQPDGLARMSTLILVEAPPPPPPPPSP